MQDYKHLHYKSSRRNQTGSGFKRFFGFLLLIAIAVLAGLYFLKDSFRQEAKSSLAMIKPQAFIRAHRPAQSRFTFYDILAKDEIAVGNFLEAQPKVDDIFIQLGAFQDSNAADNLVTVIKLKGFNPQVQSVFLADKSGRWFIVRLAQVRDELELADLKTRLEKHGIEYMIVAKKS